MYYYFYLGIRVLVSFILLFLEQVFYPLLHFFTFYSSGGLLDLFYNVESGTNTLLENDRLIAMISQCAAVLAYILLGILILLTRDIGFFRGLKIFFFGGLLIFIFNMLRIDFLVFILIEYGGDYFNAIHIVLWKFLSGLYVGFVWIFLSYKFKVKGIPLVSDVIFLYKNIKP